MIEFTAVATQVKRTLTKSRGELFFNVLLFTGHFWTFGPSQEMRMRLLDYAERAGMPKNAIRDDESFYESILELHIPMRFSFALEPLHRDPLTYYSSIKLLAVKPSE